MRKIVVYIIVVLEAVGILVLNISAGKKKADHCGAAIEVPVGMQLTLKQEYSITNGNSSVDIQEGTIIVPGSIRNNEVSFIHEESQTKLNVSWDYFNEKDQLIKLKNEAEQRKLDQQKKYIKRGVLLGVIECSCWIIISCVLSLICIRKQLFTLLIIFHCIGFFLLCIVFIFSFMYLST
ncbi:MAG: hypothetical protein IKZ29_09065 [Clostridiales bacterium]|nr:hypothetical protein [Clostridiales bacterium]